MNRQDLGEESLLGYDEGGAEDTHRRHQRLLNLLRGRWHWVALLAVIFGTGLALAGYFSQQTLYHSTGRVQINQYLPQATQADARTGRSSTEFLKTEIELIRSPRVIEVMMQDERWRQVTDDELNDPRNIASRIEATVVGRTNLVDIGFVHPDPDVAIAGLRTLLDAHKNVFSHKYENIDQAKLQQLQNRRAEKTQELLNLRSTRDNLTKDLGSDTLDPLYRDKYQQVQQLDRALNEVKLAIIAMGGESGEPSDWPLKNLTDRELGQIDQLMSQHLARKVAVEYEIQVRRNQGLGENHRTMRSLQAQLQTADEQIAFRGNQLRAGVISPQGGGGLSMTENATLDELKKKQTQLAQEIETARREMIDIGRKNRQLEILNTQINQVQKDLEEVDRQLDRMSIDEIGEHIEVISSAPIAERYNSKKRLMLTVAGGMAGSAAAVGLILLWGLVDQRFRHISDAELDLPRVLGSLPTLPENFKNPEQGVLTAYAVHQIRTLLQIGREDATNVFSITSPSAGSGKTSLTMALGLSFASAGSRTLLIDCDVVGGGLTRRMDAQVRQRLGQVLMRKGLVDQHAIEEARKAQQVSGKRIGEVLVGLGYVTRDSLDTAIEQQTKSFVGLMEVCKGQEFEACIAHTSVSGLDVLPIGSALPQQAGALSPNAIKRLVAQSRAAYDTVLIDTGPILGSIEASMAAAEADGSILIIARGDKKALVDKCVNHFNSIGANLIGVVFNHALNDDIARSSYGSVTASQSRHPNHQMLTGQLDADTSARYGPLAAAVASYSVGDDKPNGQGD